MEEHEEGEESIQMDVEAVTPLHIPPVGGGVCVKL